MRSQNEIDFSMVPSLECGSMFAALPPELDRELQAYPATYDRAKGSLTFSARMCNVPDSSDGSDVKLREAYCRASLGEFVSMEESIKYDDPDGEHHKIVKSQNPLLHIMKQLRNLQFHILSKSLNNQEQNVVWAGQESTMRFWYLEDIQIDEFNRLNDADRYSGDDKEQMISWFNQTQREWGVNQLILEAVNTYAKEILTEQ